MRQSITKILLLTLISTLISSSMVYADPINKLMAEDEADISLTDDDTEKPFDDNSSTISTTESIGEDNAPGDEINDGTYTYKINDDGNTLTVTGVVNGSKLIKDPVIPSTVNGKTVTVIGENAFSNNRGILTGKLTLPSTLETIKHEAFNECEFLTGDLVIPQGVTSIEYYAFNCCKGFSGKLTLPNGLSTIENNAFMRTGFTGPLVLPNNLTSIGDAAFYECSGFTGSLTIPSGVTVIGIYAFDECSGLTGDLIIPNNVNTIKYGAFLGCTGFTGSLKIPNNVINIEDYAFYQCTSIRKVINNTVQPCKASWFLIRSDDYFLSDTGEKITSGGVLRNGTFTKHVGVSGVSINETYTTIQQGKTVTLKPTIEPADASNQKVSWKSSDNKIATVSEEGVVKGITRGTATITVTTEDGGKTASCEVTVVDPDPSPTPDPIPDPTPDPTPTKTSIQKEKISLSKTSFTYNGNIHVPSIKKIGKYTLKEGTDYSINIVNSDGNITRSPKSAGTYIVVVTGKGNYTGMTSTKYVINKAKNPIKVTGKTATVKYSKLKKKNQTIKRSKIISISKNKGKVTYKKTKGNAKISIDEKTGKVTLQKGLKKKTYSVKVKVTAAGGKNYKKGSKTVTISIVVK